MNNIVATRKCEDYDIPVISGLIKEIYQVCRGPELPGKKVLLKPNLLSDSPPEKCITTHPAVFEAMIMFLQSQGATVFAGDSPAIHMKGFTPVKSGLAGVCERTGAQWVDFTSCPSVVAIKGTRLKMASFIHEVDLVISLPKLKNHELVCFTGAIKNTLGLVPGFSKMKQHALHRDRETFSRFLVDLNEVFTPHFFLMDGIMGMEGRGPGQGTPVKTGVLIGSGNPLALDIIASTIAGYDPTDIPVNRIALTRGKWLKRPEDIEYNGPVPESLIKADFKRIPVVKNTNIAAKFLKNRISLLRRIERRPVFIHRNCTGCRECIKICPLNAIEMHPEKKNYVKLTDSKCIRCFCCSEVCKYNAVEVKRSLFS